MRIDGISVLGLKVSIPAIFFEEQDALNFLFAVESRRLTDVPHVVHKISGELTAARLQP